MSFIWSVQTQCVRQKRQELLVLEGYWQKLFPQLLKERKGPFLAFAEAIAAD